MGRQRWFEIRSADRFYKSKQIVILPVPYWKLTETFVEAILFFCTITKRDIKYKQQPFANREQLASKFDSFSELRYHFIIMIIIIFITYYIITEFSQAQLMQDLCIHYIHVVIKKED